MFTMTEADALADIITGCINGFEIYKRTRQNKDQNLTERLPQLNQQRIPIHVQLKNREITGKCDEHAIFAFASSKEYDDIFEKLYDKNDGNLCRVQ